MIKTIKKYLLTLLFLVICGNVVALFMNHGTLWKPIFFLLNSVFSILIGFPIMKANEFVVVCISKKIDWKDNPLKRFFITLIALIVVTTICLLILELLLRLITGKGFIFASTGAAFNLLSFQILFLVYIFTLLTGFEFFKMWKEGLIKQESLQRKAVELQLDAIKNQVNPHFLFNSLNCLSSLVHKDQDLAVEFIDKLSDIYRYVLEQKDNKTISWKKEKQFLENYLELMKFRFPDHLKYEIRIAENREINVVPLSVQILVENAIKHNVISDEKPLFIEIFEEVDFIIIRNNLQPKSTIGISHNIGLDNISQQYEILSGKKVSVSDKDGYFIVKLPLIS